jgi:plasmid stabilization system protein ParE
MYKILWSDEAKADLIGIFNFIKNKSIQGAKNVISDIRNAPKSIYFSEQYSIEEYFPLCRKIVVRNYKLIYTVSV